MSGEQAVTTDSEQAPRSTEENDYRTIIETQVQLLRQLNDELLRTLRLHALLGGGVLTGVSIAISRGGSLMWNQPPTLSGLITWGFFAILVAFAGGGWISRLGSARLSYTDLRLGSPTQASLPTFKVSERDLNPYQELKSLLKGEISIKTFEERVERVDHNDISDDPETVIEHNNRVLATRERYVNTVQQYLIANFILVVGGILLLLMV